MEYFNKKIKTILHKESKVPENLSWDNMKFGINDQLHGSEKINIKSSNFPFKPIMLLGFMLAVIIILFVFKCNPQEIAVTENVQNLQEPMVQNYNQSETDKISATVTGGQKQSNKVIQNVAPDHGFQIENNNKINLNESIKGHSPSKQMSVDPENGRLTSSLLLNSEKDKNEKENDQVAVSLESDQDQLLVRKMVNIGVLKINKAFIKGDSFFFQKMAIAPVIMAEEKTSSSPQWIFGMGVGANVLWSNYFGKSPDATLLKPTNDMVIGQSVDLSLSYQFSDGRFILSDLGYSNLNEKFEVEFEKVATVLVKDALIEVDSNIITNRLTYLVKDTLLNSVERRHIIHYNNYRTLDIGLSYGRRFSLNSKWKMNYSLGFNYSRMIKSAGRTIRADHEIIDFDSSNQIYNRNHLGISSGIGFLYRFNKQVSIGSDIFILQYLDNWSKENELILKPTKLTFQLGVKYWL